MSNPRQMGLTVPSGGDAAHPSKSRLTAKVHHFSLKVIVPLAFSAGTLGEPSTGPDCFGLYVGLADRGPGSNRVRRMRMPADECGK
jgi:hypothetical protein